ncbi:MAG TPA: CHAP domain-containing protein [Spirochaetia bacterium]
MSRVGYLVVAAALLLAGCASAPPLKPSIEPSQQAERPQQSGQQPARQGAASQTPADSAGAAAESAAPAKAPRSSLLSADALGLYRTPEQMQAAPSNDELAVVASAKTLLGQKPDAKVMVNGKGFTLDCIGTVAAVFYGLSLDVTKDFGIYEGNGVNRLYMTLKERNALHTDRYPRPGDVIVWDNTWDVKGDGDRIHDPRTHAGIVLAVDEDGTIHYVHENLYKGVMIETMNLLRPTDARDEQGKLINSGLAIASKPGGPKPAHSLSGDVFNCFGDVLGLKEYFYVDLARTEGAATDLAVAAAVSRPAAAPVATDSAVAAAAPGSAAEPRSAAASGPIAGSGPAAASRAVAP